MRLTKIKEAIDHAKLRLASYVEQGMVTFIKANSEN